MWYGQQTTQHPIRWNVYSAQRIGTTHASLSMAMPQLCLDCCVTGDRFGPMAAKDPRRLQFCFAYKFSERTTIISASTSIIMVADGCKVFHNLCLRGLPPLWPLMLDHSMVFANDEGEFRSILPFTSLAYTHDDKTFNVSVEFTTVTLCHCCAQQVQQACLSVKKTNVKGMVGAACLQRYPYTDAPPLLNIHPRVARIQQLVTRLKKTTPLIPEQARRLHLACTYLDLHTSSHPTDFNVFRFL
jgi:hypothetical protein